MPRVSVVIPVYNVEAYLRQCLESLRAQTFADWEAICIDDGSTDHSLAILEDWRNRDTRVKVIHQEHAGPGVARNHGLELAIGEFALFLDADDELAPGETLRQAVEVAADRGCDVLCCSSDGLSSDEKCRTRNQLMFRADLVPSGKTYSAADAGDALFFTTVPVPWAKSSFVCGLSSPSSLAFSPFVTLRPLEVALTPLRGRKFRHSWIRGVLMWCQMTALRQLDFVWRGHNQRQRDYDRQLQEMSKQIEKLKAKEASI